MRKGLGPAFIDPAVETISHSGGEVTLGRRLTKLAQEGERITGLVFRDETIAVDDGDCVVLAVSPAQLAALRPETSVPEACGVIVNAHFVPGPGKPIVCDPPFVGLINGLAQWIFVHEKVVSVTISAAGAYGLDDTPEEELLPRLWNEIKQCLDLESDRSYSAGRIIREKRATFDQSPAGIRLRPQTETDMRNLFLAGDVVDTGLPATIEGAIRSGEMAAGKVLQTIGETAD